MTAFPHSRKLFGHTTNIRVSSFFCVLYSSDGGVGGGSEGEKGWVYSAWAV